MNKKQLAALSALPALTGAMILVYRWLARWLEPKQAWYAGFLVYWLVGCILLPLRLLDRLKFRLSVLLGIGSEGDDRDWDAIQAWAENLYPRLIQVPH